MKDQIKSYLQRLNHGEALENVQTDFVRECKEDIKDQRLSAAAALIQISGHPLQTFTLENAALEKLIARARQALENNGITDELLDELRQIAIHYARKGDLLYPHLKVQYGISGPSAVMWTVDDEIRDELNALAKQKHQKETDARIHLSGGSLTLSQLTAMLNTIPLEISFVDIDNINRYFNEGPKVFKRPGMALGREVFTCHPPKIEERVRRIIGEFRAGNLDQVPVWMDKGGRTFLVTYYAVRDKQEQYLGTLELVQDMEFAKEHFR